MALEGTLQDMSLSDLIQIFKLGNKTGILMLVANDERGVVYVANGTLVDAGILRGPDRAVIAVHDDAVIHMMQWDDAQFVFRHDPKVTERHQRIKHDGEWLVMEGMRRREDPQKALPYLRLNLETQLQLSPLPSGAESGVSLDVNQWRILSQVASCANLREISEITGLAPAQVLRITAELLAVGLVEVVPPAPPRPKARPAISPIEPRFPNVGVPAFAGGCVDEDARPAVGRGLLDAIMRRIRGL